MATISNDSNGQKRVLFVGADGKRKAIRLAKPRAKGRAAERAADDFAREVKKHVEFILDAQITRSPMPRDTAEWIAARPDRFYAKLVRAGLVNPRIPIEPPAPLPPLLLGSFLADFVKSRSHKKPRTVLNLQAAAKLLSEYFGDTRDIREIKAGDADEWLL